MSITSSQQSGCVTMVSLEESEQGSLEHFSTWVKTAESIRNPLQKCFFIVKELVDNKINIANRKEKNYVEILVSRCKFTKFQLLKNNSIKGLFIIF